MVALSVVAAVLFAINLLDTPETDRPTTAPPGAWPGATAFRRHPALPARRQRIHRFGLVPRLPRQRAQKLARLVPPHHDAAHLARDRPGGVRRPSAGVSRRTLHPAPARRRILDDHREHRRRQCRARTAAIPEALHLAHGHGHRLASHAGFLAARHEGQPADRLPLRLADRRPTLGTAQQPVYPQPAYGPQQGELEHELHPLPYHRPTADAPTRRHNDSSRAWPTWASRAKPATARPIDTSIGSSAWPGCPRQNANRALDAEPLAIVQPADLDHARSSQVCGSCHGMKWFDKSEEWTAHGFRYRPGDDLEKTTPIIRPTQLDKQPWLKPVLEKNPGIFNDFFWPDGHIRVTGREYNGLLESPCYQRGEMSCVSCHSMHKSDPDDQLARRHARQPSLPPVPRRNVRRPHPAHPPRRRLARQQLH